MSLIRGQAEEPEPRPPSPVWNARDLEQRSGWKIRVPSEVSQEFLGHLRTRPDTGLDTDATEPDIERMPKLARFAAALRDNLLFGEGVIWLKGLDSLGISGSDQHLFCAGLGGFMGRVMTEYGPLYSVRDRGADYTREAVPVSMTCAETGIHTDSSSLDCLPDLVGLLCEEPSRNGGDSLLCNAFHAYGSLRARDPETVKMLEQNFIRDVVTPGREKNHANLLRNSFPIFSVAGSGEKRTFRYMRYWIEKGHERAGRPLDPTQVSALDALDAVLGAPESIVRLRLERGDLLWINNRRVAHGRGSYRDTPGNTRELHRMWVEVPGASGQEAARSRPL
jgi:alpha-ketoglutarate-dependent taurine dioxygenase